MVNATNSLNRKRKANRLKFESQVKTVLEQQISAFDKIFTKMTKEEQDQNFCNSICGMHVRQDGNTTILMGSDAMDRYLNFQNEMVKKYSA